jgi:hypothetical protein
MQSLHYGGKNYLDLRFHSPYTLHMTPGHKIIKQSDYFLCPHHNTFLCKQLFEASSNPSSESIAEGNCRHFKTIKWTFYRVSEYPSTYMTT